MKRKHDDNNGGDGGGGNGNGNGNGNGHGGGGGEPDARERKKLKLADARRIRVQDGPVASTSSNVPVVQFDSMQGLPASLDVERFTEARAYEIDAMDKAIKSAGASATHRAWQTLPRHLRRRAASHDVRRVPVRLREKARTEMDANKRRLLGRPKRGKANQLSRTEALLKRQHDKSWLETHIWHAKRARMENMWGYRLAVTPTEKAFRPSHRASMHGSILHDASYHATIELGGPRSLLQATLEQSCDPQVSGTKSCLSGARAYETHAYKHASYPLGLLGPITILWQPRTPEPVSSTQTQSGKDNEKEKGKAKAKAKTKEKQPDDGASLEPTSTPRIVWIRCHPAIFGDVFESLRTSASYVLDQSKKKDPDVHAEIQIADLRGCINGFEIMGPKSSQVIKGALSPAGSDDRRDVKKFWDSLTNLQSSASIPRGMVIGLQVLDPRLRFPPKNAKPNYPDMAQPLSPAFAFPTALTAQSDIWDEEKRGSLKKPKYRKKDLDERRSKNPIPGTPLNPLRQDDRIPILLIQRSIEPCPPTSSNSSSQSQSDTTLGIHGWTLLFPAGWAMAFLSSLVYTGTRFAGQRERAKQCFEAGVGGFPGDYPTVGAYAEVVAVLAGRERARWERTPPAKKPNYEKVGTRSAWVADWGVVLGLEKTTEAGGGAHGHGPEVGDEGLVTTQREDPPDADADAMQTDELPPAPSPNPAVRPWLLRGPRVPTILADAFITPSRFLNEIDKLRVKNHMAPLDATLSGDDLMRSALVMVRTKMVRRGAPGEMANVYRVDDGEARRWMQVIERGGWELKQKQRQRGRKRKRDGEVVTPDESDDADACELAEVKPPHSDIIGYVTTGDVSLARGKGFAIGAVPVVRYVALRQQALRLDMESVLVKIRERDGTTCRAAYLELLDA